MEIKGPGQTTGTSKTGKTKKNGGSRETAGAFGALLDGTSSTSQTQSNASTSSVTGVDAILVTQAIDGDEARKANQIEALRGNSILDSLEDIRIGILSGTITGQRLINLQKLMEQQRGDIDDPLLAEVMDEIEVRAAVELAKFERDNS
jgi:hypothetical protein